MWRTNYVLLLGIDVCKLESFIYQIDSLLFQDYDVSLKCQYEFCVYLPLI